MKKITLLPLVLFAFLWQSNAQIFIDENLDSGFPSEWTQVSYFTSATAAYLCEGTGNIADNMFSSASNDGSFTSPNYVGISNGTDTLVEFEWLARPYLTNAVDYIMYVEYSTNDGTDWNLISSFAVTETTACTTYSEVIPAVNLISGSDFKFRIRGEWQSGDSYFYLDNIYLSQTISCPQPSGLLASNITLDTVDLSWVAGGSETDWTYEYGISPYTQGDGGITGSLTSPVLSLSGLTAGESYDIYVQANCSVDSGDSNYVTLSWTQSNIGDDCANPIVINALPYNTTDDTVNYNNFFGNGDSACDDNYLSGNDVVYTYTPSADANINLDLTELTATWSAIHLLDGCPTDEATACVGFAGSSGSADRGIEAVDVLGGTTYYIVISTFATPNSVGYTLDITENTCTNATAAYTVVSDCGTSGGFNIEVDITDMGTATAVTVTDDQGNDTQAATEATMLTFGPYTNATDVIITITDDNDATCEQSSDTLTQTVCPPSNDDCAGAEVLTVENDIADFASATQITGSILGATDSGIDACAGSNANDDVWFSFVATSTDINIDIADDFDGVVELFSGVCGSLVSVECDDYDSTNSNPRISRTDFVVGETYYFRVFFYYGYVTSTPDFTIALWSESSDTLSVDDYNFNEFTYFPNPVKNTLTLSAQNTIEHVAMYNMLGQEILRANPNAVDSDLDMSQLQTGTYFVKVTIGNVTETIRVIKQ
ncbi:T9SS type A sorting domain-containing protein [Winogradskyella undariae]|uniref:T9SS type A sorting domain-containing protein n=1 Tax=Winogradskyella undariae TaxID=1285465 RepID=UPI00156B6F62|nr:T9SS type A sorting domain-containing protein [Winogradskyella undariae]NRR92348.1 T9SS type A sorting domain-containing protein [Winogradskyella undariae]